MRTSEGTTRSVYLWGENRILCKAYAFLPDLGEQGGHAESVLALHLMSAATDESLGATHTTPAHLCGCEVRM
jgi:hypothetical protein